MCKGNCKACKHLQIPCRTINERLTVYCFECDRFGIQADHIAEIYPAVLDEVTDAKEHLKRMGKAWTVEWHGKAITAEAERQEAKNVG